MTYIDIHTHLDDKQFDEDLSEVIDRAVKAGVNIILQNSTAPESNRKTLEIAGRYGVVKAALGLHPVDALKLSDDEIEEELRFMREQTEKPDSKVIAIGEIGLDYHWIKEEKDRERQKYIFQKQINLAQDLELPVIIHSRKAEIDVIEMLEASEAKNVILHAFGGGMKLVERASKNKWYFSIPTSIVYSEHFQHIVKKANINQLFTETDAPYLGPVKEKRNEPAFVVEAAKKIAEIKGFELKEVENSILMNYKKLFG